MVYVPAGEFTMGRPDGVDNDYERPQHTVRLDTYWINRTEVTIAQFARFVVTTGHQTVAEKAGSRYVNDPADKSLFATLGVDWRYPRGPASRPSQQPST